MSEILNNLKTQLETAADKLTAAQMLKQFNDEGKLPKVSKENLETLLKR